MAVEREGYCRTSDCGIMKLTRLKARAVIMGRYGMLDCANNFENKYHSKICGTCGDTDDECHRVNFCRKWESINYYASNRKVDMQLMHSHEKGDLEEIADVILSIWDLRNGKNAMIEA